MIGDLFFFSSWLIILSNLITSFVIYDIWSSEAGNFIVCFEQVNQKHLWTIAIANFTTAISDSHWLSFVTKLDARADAWADLSKYTMD